MSVDIREVIRSIPGPLSHLESQTLADLASETDATRALEVGHYLGLSTSLLLLGFPPEVEFTTIDHHKGDFWCPATSFDEFMANVEPFVGARRFTPIDRDMADALPKLDGRFGFVFYDADHKKAAVAEFWSHAADLMDDQCTLVFDDADWDDQSTLRRFAEADGFEVVTGRELWRAERRDKGHPDTYTLEIMRRG